MTTADLERAIVSTSAMLAKVDPDQLDAATPCASWKIRDIVNHVVGGTHFFTMLLENGSIPAGTEMPDFASGDFKASYADGSKQVVAAFGNEGVMDKSFNMGFAEMPGPAVLSIATTDTFVHGWDLARSLGEPTDLDPELATKLLANARVAIPESFRGEDGKAAFGRIVDVPESAPAADQLAGFLGRQV